jgi:hypothetical protein
MPQNAEGACKLGSPRCNIILTVPQQDFDEKPDGRSGDVIPKGFGCDLVRRIWRRGFHGFPFHPAIRADNAESAGI